MLDGDPATRSVAAGRGWRVLLICGASGAGKSRISYPLARYYGVPLVEVDDIVEALRAVTTPDQLPLLHYWDTHPEAALFAPEEIVRLQIGLAEFLSPAIAAANSNQVGAAAAAAFTAVSAPGGSTLPIWTR